MAEPAPPWRALGDSLRSLSRRRIRLPGLKPAAVLVPLFEEGGALSLILTRRRLTLRAHPGEVALPGGKLDPGEETWDAALREAEEELAIPPGEVVQLGALHDVLVKGRYRMTPWVARVPPDLALRPNPDEVERVFSVPLLDLVDPARTRFSLRPGGWRGKIFQLPYFEWGDELIWGATGSVILSLLELMGMDPRDEGIQ